MQIYRYLVDGLPYYGELVEPGVLARCLRKNKETFELKRAGHDDLLDEVTLLAPCVPSKLICVGRNYADHAKELGNEAPEERPLLFFKPPSSVIAHGEEVITPVGCERLDFEGEITLVIGKRCSRVSEAEAFDYLLGVTACNDITARDWQKRDKQWSLAKGCDTFAPLGPFIDTSSAEALRVAGEGEVKLEVTTRVNGEVRQQGDSHQLIFGLAKLISYISHYFTLEAGDVIPTGTPAGVGPLVDGDHVSVELNCGPVLKNVVRGAALEVVE